ncbi:MAG TPA: MMPL family transporter [Polyangiaceae bacterium]
MNVFAALGLFAYRHRWATLAVSGLLLLASLGALARGGRLTGGTFDDTESERAEALIARVLGHPTDTTVLVVFHSDTLETWSPAFRQALDDSLAPLQHDPRVLSVIRPDNAPTALVAALSNPRAHEAVALVTLAGDFKEALAAFPDVRREMQSPALTIACTGRLAFLADLGGVLGHDLARAEIVSLPLALLVLLVVFRTVVAAALPVGVGALAVVGGIAVVVALSRVTDVAEYTVNVCSLIGLGVAIDYSLFILSRYREEMDGGLAAKEALVRALETTGPVVCFSGLALTTGLAGLLFFHGSYLAAMGVGGAIVVALAVAFALTFLPALLAVLGPRIHALRLPRIRLGPAGGFWHRTATAVMRHPVLVLVPTLAVLVAMALPLRRLEMTSADVRVLDASVEARRGYDALQRDFPELAATRVTVAVAFPSAPALDADRIGALYDLGKRIEAFPHVTRVQSIVSSNELGREDLQSVLLSPPPMMAELIEEGKKMTVGADVVLLYVLLDVAPEAPAAQKVVTALRRDRKVADGTVWVGGRTAQDMDATEFVRARTPLAVAFVTGVTLLTLFLLLGSVVLPLKAVAMNLLSVGGSFGALVWVFQEGHLGIAEPRPVEHVLPILLFCVLFGISMDYEVLMLSRIKESYERSGDNTHAVAEGLEKTAGLITSAASIMVAVFAAFALARVVLVRAVGFGMALAVALDATLVRVLLVPATMRLFGRLNWWAPAPLLRLRAALGFGGGNRSPSGDVRQSKRDG